MEINTKYFGSISFQTDEVLFFKDGLFGFKDKKEYILIRFDNDSDTLLCFQCISDESVAFIVMKPFYFLPDYLPQIEDSDVAELEFDDKSDLALYNICVIKDEIIDSTVNLRCPIIVNPVNRKSKQIVLDSSDYSFKHPFSEFLKKEAT